MEATIIRYGGQPAGMMSTGRSNSLNPLSITVLKRGFKTSYCLKGRDPINISHTSSRILGKGARTCLKTAQETSRTCQAVFVSQFVK